MSEPQLAGNAEMVGKTAVRIFLGLLLVNALVAIAAILGATGDSDWKVVGTSLLLTAGCLTVAANAAAVERSRLAQLPYLGAALSCLGFAIMIVFVWSERSDSSIAWRFTLIVLTIGLALTYSSLVAIPGLAGPFQVAQRIAYGCAGLLATAIVAAILTEDAVGAPQFYAIVCVILATATVVVLVGAIVEHRSETGPAVSEQSVGIFCPGCSARLSTDTHAWSGDYHCGRCGIGFHLEVTQPRTG